MSSNQRMSKRERQKARRDAKLAQQRAAEARARRIRLAVFAALGLVFVGLIGVAVASQRAERARLAQQEEAAAARLDELGCTQDEQRDDLGTGHLESTSLAQQPPEMLYPDRPATSGEHFGNWLKTGVYDELMDERALVHNLEHGYVVAYYADGAPEEQVAELKTFAAEQIEGDFNKIIVAPWDGELPGEANFAYAAWNARQMCAQFDRDVMTVFLRNHHSGAGEAPEKTLPAHLEEGGGTIDPGDDPFLLPPLGTDEGPTEGMTEPAGDSS